MVSHSDAVRIFNAQFEAHRSRLFYGVPNGIDRRQLEKAARRTIAEDDNLLRCTWTSLAYAITDAAALGLAIGKGVTANAYIVPFRNKNKNVTEAVLLIGYKGMIDLARRSPDCRHIHYDVVREGDAFHFFHGIGGSTFEHTPSTDGAAKRKITHAYCGGMLSSGGTFLVCMTRDELEAHGKKYSQKYDDPDSVWKKAPDVAYQKTVIRQAFNRRKMPMAVCDWRIVEKSIKYEDVIDGTFDVPEELQPQSLPGVQQQSLPEPKQTMDLTAEAEPLRETVAVETMTDEEEFAADMAELDKQQQ